MRLETPLETDWGRGFADDDPILPEIEEAADEIGWIEGVERIPHSEGGFAVAVPLHDNSLSPDTINWLNHEQLVVAWRDTDLSDVEGMDESYLQDNRRHGGLVADTLLIMPERGSYKRPEPETE